MGHNYVHLIVPSKTGLTKEVVFHEGGLLLYRHRMHGFIV